MLRSGPSPNPLLSAFPSSLLSPVASTLPQTDPALFPFCRPVCGCVVEDRDADNGRLSPRAAVLLTRRSAPLRSLLLGIHVSRKSARPSACLLLSLSVSNRVAFLLSHPGCIGWLLSFCVNPPLIEKRMNIESLPPVIWIAGICPHLICFQGFTFSLSSSSAVPILGQSKGDN